MSRLPFDPDDSLGPPPAPAEDSPARRERRRYAGMLEAQQLTVSQVSELIKTTLETRIPSPLRVIGQVSNFSSRGHWYFSLKDEEAVLSCVAWATTARKFNFEPKDGDEVIATGHVSHYGPQGRTQFYVTDLQPVGAGLLELRFRTLCADLRARGYFDETRKRPLPLLPRRIAVITSATGAALQDVISTAGQRCKAVQLLVVDVRVQGPGAAEEVARAVRWVDEQHARLGVDAVLVTRGGGSMEDLWAFNETVVADAVFRCSIPVVAAIGHESDITIIELVADVRAATPTQAAMRLVPAAAELRKHVAHVLKRVTYHAEHRVDRSMERLQSMRASLHRIAGAMVAGRRARLERLGGKLVKLAPREQIGNRRERLSVLWERLDRSISRRIDQGERLGWLARRLHETAARHIRGGKERLLGLERELVAMDPHAVLARGYSMTMRADGRLIRSVGDVSPGELIMTRVTDGTIDSRIGTTAMGPVAARPRRRRSIHEAAGQLDLFPGAQ